MRAPRRAVDLWVDRPILDYPLALGVAIAVGAWSPTSTLRPVDHGTWYQTLSAGSLGLLLLGSVVITLVFTVTPNDRLERVFDDVGQGLRRLIVRCLGGLIITTVGFAGLFLLEVHTPRWIRIGALIALICFAGLRFGRLWWLLRRILSVLMERPPAAPSPAEPSWSKPEVHPDDYAIPRRRSERH